MTAVQVVDRDPREHDEGADPTGQGALVHGEHGDGRLEQEREDGQHQGHLGKHAQCIRYTIGTCMAMVTDK